MNSKKVDKNFRITDGSVVFDGLSKAIMKLENKETSSILGVYLVTNEEGTEDIYQRCLDEPKVSDACHIGFSGWYNLNIIALRRSSRAIICDFNAENGLFFDFTLKFLTQSSTREDFLAKMRQYLNKYNYCDSKTLSPEELKYGIFVCPSFEYHTWQDEINSYIHSPYGWLHTPERFEHIRKLACQGKIAAVTVDIKDVEKMKKIKNLLQNNSDVKIDTFYISNIYDYIYNDERDLFLQSIQALCSNDTFYIDSDLDLVQRMHRYNPEMTESEALARWPLHPSKTVAPKLSELSLHRHHPESKAQERCPIQAVKTTNPILDEVMSIPKARTGLNLNLCISGMMACALLAAFIQLFVLRNELQSQPMMRP